MRKPVLTVVLGMLAAVLGATVLAGSAASKTDSAQAVGISSISPAVADRGGVVSITGHGFGARNLEVTVGGIAAELLSATGSKASFRVPALAGPGRVLVRATNPGGRVGEIGLMVRFDGVATPVLSGGAATATIGRSGGSLTAGGLTLAVPPGALSGDERITMTPLRDLAHSPLEGLLIGGVRLEPEGLRFLYPATLTMPLSAGVATSEVLGFGSAGNGSELHLQPHTIAGGTITLRLWHFSTAGAAAGGATAARAMQTHQPSSAEQQALQRIAAAQQACQAELASGSFSGPACANVRSEGVRALFDWYVNAVRPGLEAAGNAPSFVAEESLADWLAWEAEVRLLFLNDPPPACGTLQSECVAAHLLARDAVRAHADRRLDNCTGTSLASQLRDVARMADFAGAGAIDITGPPLNLPDATSGALLRECAHLEIEVTDFPAIAALNVGNTLQGQVTVDVHTGPDRTDVPFTLLVDGALVSTAADGTFQTTLTPTAAGQPLDIELEAEATNPSLQNTAFSDIHDLTRPTRQRLLLVAQGPTTVPAGGTLDLRVLVAGDGMTDDVTLTVGGLGSVGPTPVTPNAQGEATAVYTAPSSAVNPNAQVIATLLDGTSATVPITIAVVVTVSLSPTSATLAAGGTQNFTATVSNSLLGVTWSATGGEIVTTGSTTARYEARSTAGTFSVTATSKADLTKSATATVTIASGPPARVTVLSRSANTVARCGTEFSGCPPGKSDVFPGFLGVFTSALGVAHASDPDPDFPGHSESATADATQFSNVLVDAPSVLVVDVVATANATASASPGVHPEGGGVKRAVATAFGSSDSYVTFEVSGGTASFTIGGFSVTSGSGRVNVRLARSGGDRISSRSGSLAPGVYTYDVNVHAGAIRQADYVDGVLVSAGTNGRASVDFTLSVG